MKATDLESMIGEIETQLATVTGAKVVAIVGTMEDHPMVHQNVAVVPPYRMEPIAQTQGRGPEPTRFELDIEFGYALAGAGVDIKAARDAGITFGRAIRVALTGDTTWAISRGAEWVDTEYEKIGAFLLGRHTMAFRGMVTLGS